jgi:hypothetical protein
MNSLFGTEYMDDGPISGRGTQATQLLARDLEHALKLIEQRNMGETIDAHGTREARSVGVELPSELLAKGRIVEALHAACWLGMVACRAGVITGEELLGDNGLIHNMVHLILPYSILRQQEPIVLAKIATTVPKMLRDLEAKTPGFQRE